MVKPPHLGCGDFESSSLSSPTILKISRRPTGWAAVFETVSREFESFRLRHYGDCGVIGSIADCGSVGDEFKSRQSPHLFVSRTLLEYL